MTLREQLEEKAEVDEQRSPTYGQVRLTRHEQERVTLGNQNTEAMSIMEYQAIKAAAVHHGVPDWTSKVDESLTHEENIRIMERHGFGRDGGPSMRDLPMLLDDDLRDRQ